MTALIVTILILAALAAATLLGLKLHGKRIDRHSTRRDRQLQLAGDIITALEKPAPRRIPAEPVDCRFPGWCNGSCQIDRFTSELNHWADPTMVASAEYWDESVGVELYGYENAGNLDPIRIGITVGDDSGPCRMSTTLSPGEAREIGNVLTGFRATDFPYHNTLLWHRDTDVYVEFRQPRDRRNGKTGRQTVEVMIRDSDNVAAERSQLELDDAHKLGHLLIEHADQAEKSNAEFGLVSA